MKNDFTEYSTKRAIMFFNPHFILGGVDTYIYRMISWTSNIGIKTYLVLPMKATIDAELLSQIEEMGTTVYKCVDRYQYSNEVKPSAYQMKDIEVGTEIFFVTTRIPDYVVAQKIANSNRHLKFVQINYMLHVQGFICPSTAREETSLKNYLFFRTRYRYYKRILTKGSIYFMDEICKEAFTNFYQTIYTKTPILPLGIEIGDYTKHEISRKPFIILTVTRFEIPYKGYIIGLIRQFASLCEKYDTLELNIIGWGADKNRVYEAIDSVPMQFRERIKLIGPVEYNELDQYILNASVYVGMGTTLIDAGKLGIPAIAVDFFTEECYSNQLLAENIEVVATQRRVLTGELIERILLMDEKAYEKCCIETYKMIKNNYDINQVMDVLLSSDYSHQQYHMSNFEIWCHKKVNELILYLFHRNEDNRAWVDKEQ